MLEAGVSQEGGALGVIEMGMGLALLLSGLIYLYVVEPCPSAPPKGATTRNLPMVSPSPSSHLATRPGSGTCPALLAAGSRWLARPILRHTDDCYRPDAAMTSDAGCRMGLDAEWPVLFSDGSTADDLFPTVSAFLLYSV